MNQSIFACPVCRSPLSRNGNSFTCTNRHSYDISKEGYVNLLLANQKHSSDPGDSKEMLEARKSFLSRGYYKPLARAVASAVIKYRRRSFIASRQGKMTYCQRRDLRGFLEGRFENSTDSELRMLNEWTSPAGGTAEVPGDKSDFNILDAGCGEGYYTDYISKNRSINRFASIYGIDISKEGIKSASRRSNTINYAVAGIYNLPILDNSVDSLLNIFAPFNQDEFSRVLKEHGIILSVTPGAYHLFEFKKHLYDDVYLNDEQFELPEIFQLTETVRVKYELSIHNSQDISNLLKMTPYYHKSSPEKINSFLNTVHELKTTADFVIRVFTKRIRVS